MHESDPEGAASISTAIVMSAAVIQREVALADRFAECLMDSITGGKLKEDEALDLLKLWKIAREERA